MVFLVVVGLFGSWTKPPDPAEKIEAQLLVAEPVASMAPATDRLVFKQIDENGI
jgi:hypothetical protein